MTETQDNNIINQIKPNRNWFFIAGGLLLLFIGIVRLKRPQEKTELKSITVELLKDIENIKGRRSSIDFKFWTKEYENQFNILKGSITSGERQNIKELKKGQKLELLISETDIGNLGKSKKGITVRALKKEEKTLLSEEDFNKNRFAYKNRINIFAIFGGFMLFINGLKSIPNKINYLIAGIFGGLILLMKLFKFGLY